VASTILPAMSLRVNTMSWRSIALGIGLFGAAGASLLLSACGTSRQAEANSTHQGKATTVASSSTNANGVCRTVKQPQPKGAQHLAKPTLHLDLSKTYIARMVTNCGDIEIRLDAAQSPAVVASFVHLVDIGFYDDLTFHRVVAGYLIQGGDPEGDGSGGPGYTVAERPPSNVQYTKGTVAMAKDPADPPGTAGSQFFIVTGGDIDLPPQYAVLGQVIGGKRTVTAISKVPTTAGPDGEDSEPTSPIVISQAIVQGG
jgi:cyclophilin family peptidyl-prolyl cis-trans isomerase